MFHSSGLSEGCPRTRSGSPTCAPSPTSPSVSPAAARLVRARVADPSERAELWPRLLETRADFETYPTWADREIPVIVLSPPLKETFMTARIKGVQELIDRAEITDALTRYTLAVDDGDWDALDTVFAADATIDYSESGGIVGKFAEVKRWLAEISDGSGGERVVEVGRRGGPSLPPRLRAHPGRLALAPAPRGGLLTRGF